MTDIAVLVVDDDHFVQKTLASILDRAPGLVCVGCCSNGAEAVEFVAAHPVDVVIMDVRMPVMDGVEATRQICTSKPETRVIVWTSFEYDDAVAKAMGYGAAGFLLKNSDIHSLLSTITAVHHGMTVMAQGPLERWHNAAPAELAQELGLSTRDKSILALTCDGLTNAEIGHTLHLSESSVKVQISNLMRKLGAGNRVQLVVKAHGLGLYRPNSR
jgi:DNA-binding NarL/FixJ family response regulator